MVMSLANKIITRDQEQDKWKALLQNVFNTCVYILKDQENPHETLRKRLASRCKTYYQHDEFNRLHPEIQYAIAYEIKGELQKKYKKSLKLPRKYSGKKAEIMKASKVDWDVSNHGKNWSDEDIKYVFEKVSDYFSLIETAKLMKRTPWAVTLIIYAIYQEEYKKYTKYFTNEQRDKYYALAVEVASTKLTQIADLYPEFTEILTACG